MHEECRINRLADMASAGLTGITSEIRVWAIQVYTAPYQAVHDSLLVRAGRVLSAADWDLMDKLLEAMQKISGEINTEERGVSHEYV